MAQIRISKVRGVEPVDLSGGPLTIGRSSGNDLVLSSRTVSRHHCVIEPARGGGVRIRDLDSSHGTWVNGKRVSKHELADGDRIEIGRYTLLFTTADDPDVFKGERFALTTTGSSADSTGHDDDTRLGPSDEEFTLLRDDLAAMRRQLAALQIEYDQYVETASVARAAHESSRDSWNEQRQDLESSVAGRDEQLATLQGQLDEARAEAAERAEQLAALQEEIESLRAAAATTTDEPPAGDEAATPDDAAATGRDLEAERDELRRQLDDRDTKLAALQARLDELSSTAASEHDEEEARLEQVQADLAAREADVAQLQSELADLTARAEAQQDAAASDQASLQALVEELTGDRDQLRQRLDARESDLTELRARLDEADAAGREDHQSLQSRIDTLEAERDGLLEQIEAGAAEVETLRASLDEQLAALESDKESLRQQAGLLEAQNSDLQSNLEALEASSAAAQDELRVQLVTIESERESLRQERNRLERKLEGAESTIAALRGSIGELESSLDDAERADEDRGRTLERFLAISRQLRNASDQLESSRRDLQAIEAMWVKTDEQLDEAEQTGSIDAAQLARREALSAKVEQANEAYDAAVRDLQAKVDHFARLAAAEDQVARATAESSPARTPDASRAGLLGTVAGVLRRRR